MIRKPQNFFWLFISVVRCGLLNVEKPICYYSLTFAIVFDSKFQICHKTLAPGRDFFFTFDSLTVKTGGQSSGTSSGQTSRGRRNIRVVTSNRFRLSELLYFTIIGLVKNNNNRFRLERAAGGSTTRDRRRKIYRPRGKCFLKIIISYEIYYTFD